MKFISLRCPNCGGQLKVEDREQAVCIHCGHDFIIDREQTEIHNHYYNREPHSPNRSGNSPKRSGSKNFINIMLLLFLLVVMVPLITYYGLKSPLEKTIKREAAMRTIPESEPMKIFSEFLFDKKVSALTTEDFDQIKYLKIRESGISDCWEFSYSFTDYNTEGESFAASVRSIEIYNKDGIPWEDLQCFTGLTSLDISGNNAIRGGGSNKYALHSLTNLTSFSLGFHGSSSDLLKAFPNPEKLLELSVQVRNNADMEALLQFPNLNTLKFTYFGEELDDFSPLTKLSSLHSLEIDNIDHISWITVLPNLASLKMNSTYKLQDFTPLSGMTQLENLEIYGAEHLKSIDFVRNMPKLSNVTIEGSAVQTLEALEHKMTILNINLINNRDLLDMSALATLLSLKSLTIGGMYSDAVIPDLKNSEHLEMVSISSNQFLAIMDNDKIRELRLEIYRDFSATDLISLQSLESLDFVGNKILDSYALAQLPGLKKLSFDDTDAEDFHTIFALPHLETLWIRKADIGINPELFKDNETLKELYVVDCENRWRFYAGSSWGDQQSIAAFASILDYFPNIEVLSLPKSKLTSLDFVKNMPKLRELNINDNYISDISYLSGLENLEELQCQFTPVENLSLLPERVRVLTN